MEGNISNNKRKTFPEEKTSKKENKSYGEETLELFKKLDDEPELFTQILKEEMIPDKKPSKRKRKLKDISTTNDETEDEESIEANKKAKSGKTKKPINFELEKPKETKRSFTKEKENIGKIEKSEKNEKKEKNLKPKSKEKNPQQKKFTDKEATSMIQNFMIKQNRPYSVQNVIDNLAGQIKKSQCQKVLDILVLQGILIAKEYNVKIYLANQDNFEKVDQKDLNELDSQIEKMNANISELKEISNQLESEYKALNEILSNEELEKRLKERKKLLEELENKIKKVNLNKHVEIAEDKIKEAEKNYEENKNSYKKMKRFCLGVVDYLCENMDLTRKQLMVSYIVNMFRILLD